MKKQFETRSFETDLVIKEDSRTISGLAVPVESRSQLIEGSFYEIIDRNAVDENLILNNDIRLLVDHEPTRGSLGRSKYGSGTLRLSIDERGLNYEIDLPNTPLGTEILEGVKNGTIDACSFGFICEKDEWRKNIDGSYERRILDFSRLFEISLLDVAPAYTATDVVKRSLEEFKRTLDDEAKDQDEEKEDDNTNNNTDNTADAVDDDKKDVEELKALYDKLDQIKAEFNELSTID